jgi:parallel beta-helix repeat protein
VYKNLFSVGKMFDAFQRKYINSEIKKIAYHLYKRKSNMKNKVIKRSIFFLVFLLTATSITTSGVLSQSNNKTMGTNTDFPFRSHPATTTDINVMKQKLGVYDATMSYNTIYGGYATGLVPPTEQEYNDMVGSLQMIDLISPLKEVTTFCDLSADPCFPIVGSQQGSGGDTQGSCAAFAATYYTAGYVIGKQHNWNQAYQGNPDHLLNPGWTYNKCNGGADFGSSMIGNLKVIKSVGCCRESQMPYNQSDDIGWGNESAWRDAPLYRVKNIYSIPKDVNTLKATISAGYPIAFVLSSSSYGGFGSDYVLGSMDMWTNLNHGNTVVGFDDNKVDHESGETGAFKCVNQYGTDFGDHGYYWITYEAFLGTWNIGDLNTVDCLYVNDHPKLLGVWKLNAQPDRKAPVTLGIGPCGNPFGERQPQWNGGRHPYPKFMCLDISEFYPLWRNQSSQFYLDIGNTQTNGRIISFTVEYYKDTYVPGGRPTLRSRESVDTPDDTPCYVRVFDFGNSSTSGSVHKDCYPPRWRNQGQSEDVIPDGGIIHLFAQGQDETGLRTAWLATNETGVWQNITGAYGSPMDMRGASGVGMWKWSNFTWQNPDIPGGKRIGWRIYYSDLSGKTIATNVMDFQTIPGEHSMIRGYIINSLTEEPLENMSVAVEWTGDFGQYKDNTTVSDAEGFYQMNVAAGLISIQVHETDDYYGFHHYGYILGDHEILSVNISLFSKPVENSILCGYVTNAVTSEPVSNADVSLDWRDGHGHAKFNTTESNESGFYQMNVAAGTINVLVIAAGYYLYTLAGYSIGYEELLQIDVPLTPMPPQDSLLCGYINDSLSHEPIGNVDVYLSWRDNHGHDNQNQTNTDESGFYQMCVAAGTIDLRFSVDGYFDEHINGIAIGEAEILWQNVSLTPIPLVLPLEVWVDDNFNEDTPGWRIDHFNIIQEGLVPVADAGIVHVAAGTYHEDVMIQKPVTLLGENPLTTIIDSSESSALTCVQTHTTLISGFTISQRYEQGFGIYLGSVNNITITGCVIDNENAGQIGIYIESSVNVTLSENIIRNSEFGIAPVGCSSVSIINNTIEHNPLGLIIYFSSNNTVTGNTLTNNQVGLSVDFYEEKSHSFFEKSGPILVPSRDNNIYHNNFIDNTQNAYDINENNWSQSLPCGGNYWSDYTGVDANGDGIGDTPNLIPGGSNADAFPFMISNGWL